MKEQGVGSRVFWQDKNVFITGATGFVGRWLTKALLDLGANPITIAHDMTLGCLNRLLPSNYASRIQCLGGDICDLEKVARVFSRHEIQVCFHLAAQTIVGVANRSPVQTFESNIKGTWNLLEAVRRSEACQATILASTDKVYGEPKLVPIPEDHPLLGAYPYDSSKICSEIVTRTFYNTYGLSVAIARCCNIYGGGDVNYSRIIPGSMRSVILGKNPIIRGDGKSVRDFLFVQDAVNAYLLLAEKFDEVGLKGEAVNFGTAIPITVIELVDRIIRVSGKPHLQPEILGIRGKEIQVQYLDSTKARTRLHWEPRVTLDEGLSRTFEWYTENLNYPIQ